MDDDMQRDKRASSPASAGIPSVAPTPRGKVRHCFNCGADMGFIEDRYYDRFDPCGSNECVREARDIARQERDDAHDRLDRDNGWDRW